jgi:hypothetical protein
MENQPDLSFYFAIHQAQRDGLDRYLDAVSTLTDGERVTRARRSPAGPRGSCGSWRSTTTSRTPSSSRACGPGWRRRAPRSTASRATTATSTACWPDGPPSPARWPTRACRSASPRADAAAFAREIRDFLHGHLAVEDQDLLPLFWRHYTAAEYDAVVEQAVKKGKKAGLWFVAPFTVDCYPEGPARDEFLASVPGVLRLLHRLVRPSYDRLVATALGPVPVTDAHRS